MKEVTAIGSIIAEFNEQDTKCAVDRKVFEMECYPAFEKLWISNDEVFILAELEIYPGRRKVYRNDDEIALSAKEFDLLCLLVVNKEYVLTYTQIYEKIWGEDSVGDINNSVGCHIRSLRRKLLREYPDAPFTIQCLRDIGYRLEMK